MTGVVKMRLVVTTQEVTSDYVFDCLFKISKKSLQDANRYAEIAKQIMVMASKRGQEGLYANDWQAHIDKLNIKSHIYFSILKRLKAAGLLRKTGGKYYIIRDFPEHLAKMVGAMNSFYMDLGRYDTPPVKP